MKKISLLAKILTVAISFVLVAACFSSCSTSDTVKIGFIGPLTGDIAEYGTGALNAAKLYIDNLNEKGGIGGKQIELIALDDKGNKVDAVNCYETLMSENVVAIVGAVTSAPTIAVAQKSAADGIPMMTPTATQLEVTDYGNHMFRACFIDSEQGKAISYFAKNTLNAKTAAVIYNQDDAYSVGIKDAFSEYCSKYGISVVVTESYGKDDVDFTGQVAAAKAKNPDVILLPDYYNTVYKIASAIKSADISAKILGVDGTDGVLGIENANVSVFEGMYFCNHYSPDDTSVVVQDFVNAYKAKYNTTPSALAALGYDGAMIICNALQNVVDKGIALEANKECWNAIIAELDATDIDCVTGHVSYDAKNNPQKTCTIINITAGQYKLFQKLDYIAD